MARQLIDPPYLQFPLRVTAKGGKNANRKEHIRGQIEQVLFTSPGERVFRPEFGAGLKNLVFEPNTSVLRQVTHKRLLASLAQALKGEVEPQTIEVNVLPDGAKLKVLITYTLATIGFKEQQEFTV